MEKVNISYLVPVLITHKNKKYLCMFDTAESDLYFLDKDLDESEKNEATNAVLETLVGHSIAGHDISIANPTENMKDLLSNLKNNNFENLRNFEIAEDENARS